MARKVKVTNVRIGDWICEKFVNGNPSGFYGKVSGITHISPRVIEIMVTEHCGVVGATTTFVVDDYYCDTVYRERS